MIVYVIITQNFQNTNYWYYCVNEHSFTINDCDILMKIIRYSQCEIIINEIHHQFANEIKRIKDLKIEFKKRER